ncbi:MAG TPA: EthD domain-containing protein [Acidimicrobiales bacterium]|nr:EthD domain-containing protein [Acidimicrobiales bacterium]
MELWPEPGRVDGVVAAWGATPDLGLHAAYVVDEVIQRDHGRPGPAGGPTPGIKIVYLVERTPGLTVEQFVDHWRNRHGPLALRHHVGATRYVQNAVTARLAAATGDPVVGLAELHFASAHDLVTRMYDSPEGMRAIGDDVARFVGAAAGYLVTEHVL